MVFYTENLYNKVIEDPAVYFDRLSVISGYASSQFLKKVMNDFPEMEINLYIGMALQGITENNHAEFTKICKEHPNVQVYYQKDSPMTHMKIYQWYQRDVPGLSFVGSANFSESGFFGQKEILSPVLDTFSEVVEEVFRHSINCLHPEVLTFIPITQDNIEHNSEDFDKNENYNQNSHDGLFKASSILVAENNSPYINHKANLKKLLLRNKYIPHNDRILVELILKDDPHWATKSLNVWMRLYESKEDSYIDIDRTNKGRGRTEDFFPRNQKIVIYSDDYYEWKAQRTGEYGKELKVTEGINFYDYFLRRLDIREERPISYKDLLKYGRTNAEFIKLEKNEYLMDFSIK